ncbi:MAG TPA: hypothetical protein VGH45_08175 [Solirubrobacteraceae bacterium]|jgi:hypothetical protein
MSATLPIAVRRVPPSPPAQLVGVRLSLAEGADREAIRHLAALAGSAPPHGPAMLAELDGELVAAVGFAEGDTLVHPTHSHPAITAHLRLRRLEARLIATVWGA